MRVAVVGSDVGAQAFAAFLKHRVPAASITCFPSGDRAPKQGITFSSPWIRNDKKGRLAVLKLGREILGIGDREFCVSKVNSALSIMEGSDKRIVKIPSFISVVRNMFALGLEPFRSKFKPTQDISVFDFIATRFGVSFAQRYSDILTAPFSASTISVHALFPKVARNFFRFNSVLLGPVFGLVASVDQLAQSKQFRNVDVMDHLWQELVSGGKYVSMGLRFDFSLFHEELGRHVADISTVGVLEGFKPADFDLVVSSQPPVDLVQLVGDTEVIPEWARHMSESKRVYATRFHLDQPVKTGAEILFTAGTAHEDGVCGIIRQSGLYEAGLEGTVVDVLSSKPVEWRTVQGLCPSLGGVEVVGPGVVNEEQLPVPAVGWSSNLVDFNRWRLGANRKTGAELQVVGKWYYCPTGSLTELVWDADALASLVADRFAKFPKRVENEQRVHWMSRNDRSLDFSYSDSVWAAHRVL